MVVNPPETEVQASGGGPDREWASPSAAGPGSHEATGTSAPPVASGFLA